MNSHPSQSATYSSPARSPDTISKSSPARCSYATLMIIWAGPSRRALSWDRRTETRGDSFTIAMKIATASRFRPIIKSIEILARVGLFSAGKCGSRSSARAAIAYLYFSEAFWTPRFDSLSSPQSGKNCACHSPKTSPNPSTLDQSAASTQSHSSYSSHKWS